MGKIIVEKIPVETEMVTFVHYYATNTKLLIIILDRTSEWRKRRQCDHDDAKPEQTEYRVFGDRNRLARQQSYNSIRKKSSVSGFLDLESRRRKKYLFVSNSITKAVHLLVTYVYS